MFRHLFVAVGWTMTTDRCHDMTYLDGRSSHTHHAKSSKGNIAVGRTASGKCNSLGSRGEAHHGEDDNRLLLGRIRENYERRQ